MAWSTASFHVFTDEGWDSSSVLQQFLKQLVCWIQIPACCIPNGEETDAHKVGVLQEVMKTEVGILLSEPFLSKSVCAFAGRSGRRGSDLPSWRVKGEELQVHLASSASAQHSASWGFQQLSRDTYFTLASCLRQIFFHPFRLSPDIDPGESSMIPVCPFWVSVCLPGCCCGQKGSLWILAPVKSQRQSFWGRGRTDLLLCQAKEDTVG